MSALMQALNRLSDKLGTELFLEWNRELQQYDLIDPRGGPILLSCADYELLEGILGLLDEPLPDCVDVMND